MTTTITSTKEVGANGWTAADFHYTASGTVAKVKETPTGHIEIIDGEVDDAYRLVDMVDNTAVLESLTVQRVTGHFRRGFVKVRRASNILIEDCVGIGQGEAGTTESFPTGFQTENFPVNNLIARRSIMRGFWSSDLSASYRNGDGWATEEAVTNALFEDCIGSDNADAGFDLKGQVKLVRCLAEDNHRNFRFWGNFDAQHLTSINPRNAHLWLGGGTRLTGGVIDQMTFIGGDTKPHVKIDSSSGPADVVLIDPTDESGHVIPFDRLRIDREGGSKVNLRVEYTAEGLAGNRPARRPQLDTDSPIIVTPEPEPERDPEPEPELGTEPEAELGTEPEAGTEPEPERDPEPEPDPVDAASQLQEQMDDLVRVVAAIRVSAAALLARPEPDQMAATLQRLADIAHLSRNAPGGSADKSSQIAAIHDLAAAPLID